MRARQMDTSCGTSVAPLVSENKRKQGVIVEQLSKKEVDGNVRSKAKSAVTGGFPEDMNGMPPTKDPEKEGPIYDGSQLAKPAKALKTSNDR